MSNQNRWIIGIGILTAILAIATPIYLYIKDFYALPRSTNPSDWGTFGDYIGGILNPIVSFLTLIVTIVIAINIRRIESRNHEETVHNPVKPFFVIGDGYFYSSDISAIGPSVEKDCYGYTEPQEPAGQFDYQNKQFYLKVSNKGIGVATDVIVTFEINLEELAKSLNIDDPKIKTTVSAIRTDEDGRDFIVLTIDAEEHFHYKSLYSKILAKEKLRLGVIEKDKETSAVVPSQMMAAFQLQNLIRRLKDGDLVFPTLLVTFDYKNIYGRELSTKFRIGLVYVHDYGRYTVFRLLQEQV
ncbi:hypothetical protein [Rufibacter sp. XAAS-G3-1]|uniref:hypothetical protein n=1 Tax=Rufibacter sp. XAAS-G3-1 TaxID=2729134 RepID=UPI0015E6E1B5|nr:hypothetical protein [Rufibacter sp. XAAS-G3-1]